MGSLGLFFFFFEELELKEQICNNETERRGL